MVRRSAHGRAWSLSALLVLLAAFVVVDSGIQDFFTPVDPVALSYGTVLLNLTESSEHNAWVIALKLLLALYSI